MSETQQARSLERIASDIRSDWKEPYFGAVPYLEAMAQLDRVSDSYADGYGQDSSRSIVLYFLSNAKTWRGETAKAVKAELRELVKR